MNNPEPFLIVKSTQEISIKKAISKMKSFLESSSNETATASQIRVGKVSDELLEKLQTVCTALQSQIDRHEEQKQQKQSQKKSSKKRHEPDAGIEEEIKPKKKKSRKSSVADASQ
jgi:sugar-specific transcriptional regulator TrmB